jgi:hypothetical protein
MLRLWEASTDEGPVYRASLESPHTGERQAFADLAALFAFLQEKTEGFMPKSPPDAPLDPANKEM